MAHNQEMLEKHAESGDWKNVRLIGLSRDQDQKKLADHVEAKKWTSVEHYWQANGKGNSHKDFNVNGIPHCILVDTHGKIVWIGHPASRNLEEDINNLLAGKVLEVKGDDDSEEEKEEGGSDSAAVDFEKAAELAAQFEAESKVLQEPAAAEIAKKVNRAFLVLVGETKLDVSSGALKSKLTCHTAMQGAKDDIDALVALTKPISHKDGHIWKHVERITRI
jgi:hypothetical protein